MPPTEPSAEGIAQAVEELEAGITLAQSLARLPESVLDRLTAILRTVGSMSQDEKAAAALFLATSAMYVLSNGSPEELATADLLTTTAEFVELTHLLTHDNQTRETT